MLHSTTLRAQQALSRFRDGASALLRASVPAAAFILLLLSSAHAATINNTASFNYTSAPAPIAAGVDITASGTSFDNASIAASFSPNVVVAGNSTTVTIQITNNGLNDLANGIITITPPPGTLMTIPSVPGQYSVVILPGGDIEITLANPLVPGAAITVSGTVDVPPGTPSGTPVMVTSFAANGIPIASATTPLTIQNIRTPSTIAFMQPDTGGILIPATVYHAGEAIYVQVTDGDQNINPGVAETVMAILVDSISGDTETIILTETGPNTGVFVGSIPSAATPPVPADGTISVAQGSSLTATYTDQFDATDVSALAVLVDPFGVIFDSSTGAPVDGIQVTLIDTATGLPASVFGDDGVSTFPATVITGTTATDSSGKVYNFIPGGYRFPFVSPGNYQLQVVTPVSYSHPSTVPTPTLQLLPGAPFSIVNGSRGEIFVVNPGPALHIDIPIDPKAVGLFLRKDASKQTASVGDFVQYRISIENPSTIADATGAQLQDILPAHFRYQKGSAKLDGIAIADPVIAANGRTLSFTIGTVTAGSVRNLSYVTSIGAGTPTGKAINSVAASATQLGAPIASNRATATIMITEDLISSRSFLTGRVFLDTGSNGAGQLAVNGDSDETGAIMAASVKSAGETGNGVIDKGEKGVAGVRIYLEDGTFTITDENGLFHFEGVRPGRHVVQLDTDSLPARYQVIGLKNNRFAGSDFSQFVDVAGGAVWRTNFRIIDRAPPSMPVTVSQQLSQENDKLWTTVEVKFGEKIELSDLSVHYRLPGGWKMVRGTAVLDGEISEPSVTGGEMSWKLDPAVRQHRIRFSMQGGGGSGDKQAVAFARFTSIGSPQGRTGDAAIDLHDTLLDRSEKQDHTLHLNFDSRKATVPAGELAELDALAEKLKESDIRTLTVEGHTDNLRLRRIKNGRFNDNQELSEGRALFVANYLAGKLNLDLNRVFAVGKAEHEPVADNRTVEGRAKNRRVVIKLNAEKITHQHDTVVRSASSEGEGRAEGSWDSDKKGTPAATVSAAAPEAGFITPLDRSSLPHRVGSVRITLDSRLTPLLTVDGRSVPSEKIGFTSRDEKSGRTTYTYIGVEFGDPGEHILRITGNDPFGNSRFEQTVTVIRTGEIADIKLLAVEGNVADGATPVRLHLQLRDNTGKVITGSAELEHRGGDLYLPVDSKRTEPLTPAEATRLFVDADGWITLAPTSTSGSHHIILGYNDVQRDIEVFVKPAYRDWIMVGFGEGSLGYNKLKGAVQPINKQSEKDGYYQDGKLAFYAKGKVSGDFLLTLSYDTSKTRGSVGNSLYQTIDPNSLYTVYGDASQQQYDAASQRKLYLKLEKDTFYAMFGDFDSGLTVTELSRYSRQLNGIKSELRGDMFGYTAFATQTSKALAKDELRGDGTSGLYRLSRSNITANTEVVKIETRDRFRSEVIIESRLLVRHLDYDIDYLAGTLYFKQPVMSRDANMNPIYIRVEYESDDQGDQLTAFGGRGSVRPVDALEVGATYIQQGQIGKDDRLTGVDARLDITEQTELVAEAAQSNTQQARANAWKAELRHNGERLSGTAYYRQVDNNFGLGQVTGSENATRKFGATTEVRISDKTRIQSEAYRQDNLATTARRDAGSIQGVHDMENASLRLGARTSHDTDGAGTKLTSNQVTAGATARVTDKLSFRADREQSIGKNDSADFPTRTLVGADYRLTASTVVSATQEWAQSDIQKSNSTRVGIRTQPWSGAQLATSYEQQFGEGGVRSFANVGLQQQWQATDALSFTTGLDRTHTLRNPGAKPLNVNVPLTTGNDNFSAVSLGMDYRPEAWSLNTRAEFRTSNSQRKWNATAGIQGDPAEDLSTLLSLQWSRDKQLAAASTTTSALLSLGAAYRPAYDTLTLIDRFDIRYGNQQSPVTTTMDWRYINNLTANWQTLPDLQIALNYGAKLSRDTIDGTAYRGFTDLIGLQATYDINELWDISVQGGLLHSWQNGQQSPSAGIALGYNIMNNTWIGIGYNFTGFYDADFAASEFTRKGPYMRLRFKFDQNSLAELLKSDH